MTTWSYYSIKKAGGNVCLEPKEALGLKVLIMENPGDDS